jgi:tRNA threonylcarbamoyl adenosine modification protein YeaZ
MSEPLILAIDSATHTVSISVCSPNAVLATHSILSSSNLPAPTASIANGVQHVLRSASVYSHQILLLAIPQGPGSFNGLRSAFAFAKGFALQQGCALACIPTLQISVHPLQPKPANAIAVLQAGRGRIAAQSFHWQNGWQPSAAGSISTWESLFANLPATPCQLCGEVDASMFAAAGLACPPQLMLAGNPERSPAVLATLGYQHWQSGSDCNPLTAQPIYWQQPG